ALLKDLINKFEKDINNIIINKLDIAFLNNIKIDKYIRISESSIELKPNKQVNFKALSKALSANKLNLITSINNGALRLSLPTITAQRREIALNSLSERLKQFKASVRGLRREAINKMKLIKHIGNDVKLLSLKQIDNNTNETFNLSMELYSKTQKRLLN
ncbi:MAG: ribosome recycling factor, partial [Candidatus Hodgkinia cicadicola]